MNSENVKPQIDKNLLDFMNGEHNVLISTPESPVSLARSYKNGREYIGGYYGDIQTPVTYGPNYAKGKKREQLPTQDEIRAEKSVVLNKPPKGTGGREAYVMILTRHEDKIKGLSVTAKAILFDMCLSGIQWNTGKLVQNRSKKPHTIKSIAATEDICEKTAKAAMKQLSEHNIIKYDKSRRVYFLSSDIARKGAVIEDENKI
jgi:hypothetical protein